MLCWFLPLQFQFSLCFEQQEQNRSSVSDIPWKCTEKYSFVQAYVARIAQFACSCRRRTGNPMFNSLQMYGFFSLSGPECSVASQYQTNSGDAFQKNIVACVESYLHCHIHINCADIKLICHNCFYQIVTWSPLIIRAL